MVFFNYQRLPTPGQPPSVAVEDGAGHPRRVARPGDERASGQADDVVGVGHGGSFVEVVDAPHETALGVAPGAEVVQVDVAHAKHQRCRHQTWATVRELFRPPVEGGPEERQRLMLAGHLVVLFVEVLFDNRCLSPQPILVVGRRLHDTC